MDDSKPRKVRIPILEGGVKVMPADEYERHTVKLMTENPDWVPGMAPPDFKYGVVEIDAKDAACPKCGVEFSFWPSLKAASIEFHCKRCGHVWTVALKEAP